MLLFTGGAPKGVFVNTAYLFSSVKTLKAIERMNFETLHLEISKTCKGALRNRPQTPVFVFLPGLL
jgi:hypothetical protein